MINDKIKLMICDDLPSYCNYLNRLFKYEDDIFVTGIAHSASKCLELFKSSPIKPDILLLDIQMETATSGADIVPELLDISPETKITMLTVDYDDNLIFRSITNGAVNYIIKSIEDEDLLNMVRNTFNGGQIFSQKVTDAIVSESIKSRKTTESLLYIINIISKLTTSEYEVLQKLCDGMSYGDIAKFRSVEEITIRSQASRIMKKFDMEISDLIEMLKNLKFFDIVKNRHS